MSISRLKKLREQKSMTATADTAALAAKTAIVDAFVASSAAELRKIMVDDFPYLSFKLACPSSTNEVVDIKVHSMFWMGLTCGDYFHVSFLDVWDSDNTRSEHISRKVAAFMSKVVRNYRTSVSLMLPSYQRAKVSGCYPALSSHGVPDSIRWVFSDGSALVCPVGPVDVSASLVSASLGSRRDSGELLDLLEAL